jgi:esterase
MLNFRHLGGEGNPPMIILHGLLGSSRNWVKAGKALASRFNVFALDLPNHGDSSSMPDMSFDAVSKWILEWMDERSLTSPILLGHSLGGKVAMSLASGYPHRCKALAVVDIAPREYEPHSQAAIKAMCALDLKSIQSRRDAEDILRGVIPDLGLRRFMLTNLVWKDGLLAWQVNLTALLHSLPNLISSPMTGHSRYDGPALFLKGEDSDFIKPEDEVVIQDRFPQSRLITIPQAGHNVHFDNLPFFVDTVFRCFYGLSV